MSEWIPIADAEIENNRYYWMTWKDRIVVTRHSGQFLRGIEDRIVAVMPADCPKPYVGPAAPPSPKHREWHFDGEPRVYTDGQPTLRTNAIVHAGPPVNGGLHVREVLPGDPTPEAIAKAIDGIEYHAATKWHVSVDTLDSWLKLLTGK